MEEILVQMASQQMKPVVRVGAVIKVQSHPYHLLSPLQRMLLCLLLSPHQPRMLLLRHLRSAIVPRIRKKAVAILKRDGQTIIWCPSVRAKDVITKNGQTANHTAVDKTIFNASKTSAVRLPTLLFHRQLITLAGTVLSNFPSTIVRKIAFLWAKGHLQDVR